MSHKKWINTEGSFTHNNLPSITEQLPSVVYELNFDVKRGFYLEHVSNSFKLPSKIYDNEKLLIDRVKKTFNGFNQNFGILLKGTKGTGKTITAKQICNDLNLPVILINQHFGDISGFIHSIEQDVIIMFDEFEKTYNLHGYDEDIDNPNDGKPGIGSLLTLMDGVFTTSYKRLFVLTTNKEWLPDAMMSRPSRIRYVKTFGDLSHEAILQILNDIIKDKSLIKDVLDYCKHLEIITVDIIKSIADEVNLYGEASPDFLSLLNAKLVDEVKSLVKVNKDGSQDILLENYDCSSLSRKDHYIYISKLDMVIRSTGEVNKDQTVVYSIDGSKDTYNVKLVKSKKIHASMEAVF